MMRSLLALFPALALNWPIKKIAAVAALLAGAGYLLISGGAISTQRAFIMLTVMFIAVLFDRPAISLRNLAMAATMIVILTPESVLSASFQMSFMAVMGLIAAYEALRAYGTGRPKSRYSQNIPHRIARWFATLLMATALTTVIASFFTGLPAAYHFNRVAPFGVLANVLALPMVTFLVMPMAVLAVALMPLELEAWPLWLMEWGLRWVTDIAEYVANLPHSNFTVPTLRLGSALLFGAALIWLCLWTGWLRLYAALPALLATLLVVNIDRPDVLIERTGKNVGYRAASGELVLAHTRRAKYSVGKWLLRDGDSAEFSDAVKRPGWTCSKHRCQAVVGTRKVAYLQDGATIPEECLDLQVLISQIPLRGACDNVPVRIDRFDLWRSGSHAIYFDANDTKIVTASSVRGRRPWTTRPIARRKIRLNPYARY